MNISIIKNLVAGIAPKDSKMRDALDQIVSGLDELDKRTAPEGTDRGFWKPVVTFGGGSVGQAYSVQDGEFIKIFPELVYVRFRFVMTNKGTSVGGNTIALPIPSKTSTTISATTGCWPIDHLNMAGLTSQPNIVIADNLAFIVQSNGASRIQLTDVNFTNTTTLAAEMVYMTGNQ